MCVGSAFQPNCPDYAPTSTLAAPTEPTRRIALPRRQTHSSIRATVLHADVASKFALEGLTATLAAEARAAGNSIRVNSISPGMVDTASFPKAPGRPGVRSAESIKDGLFYLLLGSDASGSYLHVDEYDEAVAAGVPSAALKPIDEAAFACEAAKA